MRRRFARRVCQRFDSSIPRSGDVLPHVSATTWAAPVGSQMLIWSSSLTMTSVMATVACVASVLRGWPRTVVLAKKLESHSALSPGANGGISAGGAAGSNVWLAKTTGSLLISTGACRGLCVDERSLDVWQPYASPPSNTQGTRTRSKCNMASVFHFAKGDAPNHSVCVSQ
jgi:hypothetical protein